MEKDYFNIVVNGYFVPYAVHPDGKELKSPGMYQDDPLPMVYGYNRDGFRFKKDKSENDMSSPFVLYCNGKPVVICHNKQIADMIISLNENAFTCRELPYLDPTEGLNIFFNNDGTVEYIPEEYMDHVEETKEDIEPW